MGNEESRQEAQGGNVSGYMIQWAYPGQWFDELGSLAMTFGDTPALGVDIGGRVDIDRNNKDELARAIRDSGITAYD